MIKKILYFSSFLFIVFFSIQFGIAMMGCGSSGVNLDEDEGGGAGSSCSESSGTTTSGDVTTIIYGNPCNAPSPSISSTTHGLTTLGCTDRTTTDSAADYTSVTCGTDDDAATSNYYCSSNVVYKKGDSADTALYATTNATCSDDNTSISEEEVTVSLKRFDDFDSE